MSKRAIVIGAGIAGLAAARTLAVRNYDVTVFERNGRAVGASVRNFGMIWPIGQPDGELYERAMLSKSIWKEICREANIWHDPVGSLHLAYNEDEWNILQELSVAMNYRNYHLLTPAQTLEKSEAVAENNLKGSLYSPDEMIVDPRKAMTSIPFWLTERYGVNFLWGKAVTDISYPCVYAGKEQYEADEIYVCSGADFETLYPEIFSSLLITKCKLQMMRIIKQPGNWRIGPALCGGLSLLHYNSFKVAPSLPLFRKKMEEEYAEYLKWGIHVMVCQNEEGELTVGDSHEYGLTHDPFDKRFINKMIADYLGCFTRFRSDTVVETWNGIYPKLTRNETELILQPEPGVTIINGLGGAGMTLGFGLCEQVIGNHSKKILRIV